MFDICNMDNKGKHYILWGPDVCANIHTVHLNSDTPGLTPGLTDFMREINTFILTPALYPSI